MDPPTKGSSGTASPVHGTDARLAALCNRMGRLWSEQTIEVCEVAAPQDKVEECKLTLVGKVLTIQTINSQAFQNTMKLAWRTENVAIHQSEEGLYVIKFKSEADKQRILDGGPWRFSNHLVILKPWLPNTPLHCYDFSKCEFWMHVIGLPLEWYTNSMLRKVVRRVGRVLIVKFEQNNALPLKAGKVRVELNLQQPLIPGQLIQLDGKTIWLDFRYERLSHYCYSCGVIGHYATHCTTYPFDIEKADNKDNLYYGNWLRAEVNQHSPFWNTFYGTKLSTNEVEEVIPETPHSPTGLIPATQPHINTSTEDLHIPNEGQIITAAAPLQWKPLAPVAKDPITRKLPAKLKQAETGPSRLKKLKHSHLLPKAGPMKKAKRFGNSDKSLHIPEALDDTHLQENPIFIADEPDAWALVASPKQPPSYK
ncbi:uncharacterized protein LOC120294404 [Eucalyptus grandis]|uniref:uncharacterized protein LOC120294404 n=1 Tax=Eucalyptus grandis TaxID=71139 RepID=UPI00192EF750|nr:uncharacterized protein LOC120294404 [Eucalyptus grandis]